MESDGAADEAVLNNVQKKERKKSPLLTFKECAEDKSLVLKPAFCVFLCNAKAACMSDTVNKYEYL